MDGRERLAGADCAAQFAANTNQRAPGVPSAPVLCRSLLSVRPFELNSALRLPSPLSPIATRGPDSHAALSDIDIHQSTHTTSGCCLCIGHPIEHSLVGRFVPPSERPRNSISSVNAPHRTRAHSLFSSSNRLVPARTSPQVISKSISERSNQPR